MFSFFKQLLGKSSDDSEVVVYTPPEGSKNRSLEEIDTSYWKTDDKAWMAKRRENWPFVEQMLHVHKPSKALSIIKAYYLRGRMPNWQALKNWQHEDRHVDLLVFLWLHPSWDEALLKELRDLYINSDLIVLDDIKRGLGMFLWTVPNRIAFASSMEQLETPYFEGHGELLFRVLLGDPVQEEFRTVNAIWNAHYKIRKPDLVSISIMSILLTHSSAIPAHEDYIFQYDQPLEWWYQCAVADEAYCRKTFEEGDKPGFKRALYRIFHFDTKKEGDTCRTRFALKLRQLLNEREFTEGFKQMWEEVKSGKIVVDDAW